MSKNQLKVRELTPYVSSASKVNDCPGSDDENEHRCVDEDLIDITRPTEHTPFEIEQFPLPTAGMPIPCSDRGPSSFEAYQQTVGSDNDYAPFNSRLDWDIARWAKMHGLSSSAVTKLLEIEGVSQRFFSFQLCIIIYYSLARCSAFHTATFASLIT